MVPSSAFTTVPFLISSVSHLLLLSQAALISGKRPVPGPFSGIVPVLPERLAIFPHPQKAGNHSDPPESFPAYLNGMDGWVCRCPHGWTSSPRSPGKNSPGGTGEGGPSEDESVFMVLIPTPPCMPHTTVFPSSSFVSTKNEVVPGVWPADSLVRMAPHPHDNGRFILIKAVCFIRNDGKSRVAHIRLRAVTPFLILSGQPYLCSRQLL